MKLKIIISLFLFLIFLPPIYTQTDRKETGNLVMEGIPEIPQRIKEKTFQYQNTRSANLAGWLRNDKGILILTRFGETSQVHKVEIPGGARKQLTFFPEPVNGASICPDSNSHLFLFLKDVGGSEFFQIFSFDMRTGSYKMITDGKSRNSGPAWSNKGNRYTFSSTKRNGKDTDIYLMKTTHGSEAEPIITEGGHWSTFDWSPDDSKLIVNKFISANESYIYIYDLNSKLLEQINPIEEKISYTHALWKKDGSGIYVISDEDSEFRRLKFYDLNSKKLSTLTSDIHWDIEEMKLSYKGDLLAFRINEDGFGKLYLMNTKTNYYKPADNIPKGLIVNLKFDWKDERLAFIINTPKTPGDIYSLNLKNNQVERWTFSEVGGLNAESFIEPELIKFPTFDKFGGNKRMIPAFYFKPRGSGPFPVLIDIHGGPEGQYKPYFSSFTQYLVNEMGIAVIGPNVRGSTGYGKTYLQLDNGFKREESVKDIGKLLEWIGTRPELDSSRIAVYGRSYGGYMVLSSMTHFDEKIKCGIDIVGISNFITFLKNTQDYRRDLRRAEYGDERDPKMYEFFEKIAPLNNADKITKPMFIVQGLNDPRVPVTESEQIVSAIRKNKGEVWYLLAKDEGHAFQKQVNKDYLNNSIMLFLEEHLLK